MHRTLTAGLTALSLMLLPAAPAQAQGNDDLNRAVIALIAAGVIGLAIKNNREDNKSSAARSPDVKVQVHRNVHDRRVHPSAPHSNSRANRDYRSRPVDPVPGRCFRRVQTTGDGYHGVFLSRCLDVRYRDAHSLPRGCAVQVGGHNSHTRGYSAKCLYDYGYRSDGIWH